MLQKRLDKPEQIKNTRGNAKNCTVEALGKKQRNAKLSVIYNLSHFSWPGSGKYKGESGYQRILYAKKKVIQKKFKKILKLL